MVGFARRTVNERRDDDPGHTNAPEKIKEI
jgi:hypothetical protein